VITIRFYIFSLTVLLLTVAHQEVFAQRDKKKKSVEPTPLSTSREREAEFFFTEGEKYFILEDYAKALLYFERVADLQPTNAAVHYKIAEVLSKSAKEEDLMNAARHIDIALKNERKNKYLYLLASNIYSSLGQFEKSAEALEGMMKEVKGTEDYLFELAAIYLYGNKTDEALRVYNLAEQILGVNEVSSLQKQRIFFDQGKTEEAMREGEKLISAFPDEERYVLGLAETLSQQGQGAKAIEYVENFLKENPDAGSSKMLLAGLYRDNGQEKKSRELVLSVVDDTRVDVSSKILMLGMYSALLTQNKANKVEDAELNGFVLEVFKKLDANHPEETNVHLVGGDIFMTLDRNKDAEIEYRKAVRGGTASYEAWQNLLMLESQSDSFDSLIVHSDEALELFPNQGMIYYFNGYGHLRKKHFNQAALSLEQAKKLSSTNPQFVNEINSMLGDAYEGAKEFTKSERAYDEALEFNPNNDLVLNNYSYYLAIRKQNLEKAEKMSAQLIKDHPENIAYLDTHAWVLYMREKYKEAKKVIEKAINSGKASYIHFEHYGDILYQLGDVDNAVLQWQKAKSMGGDNAVINKKIANRRIL
jgi:Flp pilus assembly protein TadD, contains TPR repeats